MADTRVKGIDTSFWEGAVNCRQAYANGARYIIPKASQWHADAQFAATWEHAKGVMPRGAFHFMDWGWGELGQAKLFCDTMGGDWGELPPTLDLEQDPRPYGLSAAAVCVRVVAFMNYVEQRTGRTPMLYTGYYYWNDWGSNSAAWLKYPFWLAWYTPFELIIRVPKPWTRWTLWQHTAKANGIAYGCQAMGVDENLFNGDQAALDRFAGGAVTPTPPPSPTGLRYQVIAGVNANVRTGPATYFPVIRIAMSGSVIYLRSVATTNGYAQLVDGGWVTYAYVKPT